ncbi:MAG: DUF2254 domain-containing protein [Alphaproteobacteria bacterium]|nr:DUF2254 domain-containing protein [Alphaproteobacteria bacterium]
MMSNASVEATSVHFTVKFKNRFKDRPFFTLFVHRLFIYLVLLILAVIVVWLGYPIIGAGQMLVDNVRTSLSVLVQTQGAIIAIVITLTLVAVQTTATTSSAKLIHYVIRKNPDVWMLLFFYIAAILYGLWVLHNLTLVSSENSRIQIVASEFRNYVFMVYALGIFTFIVLIPYFQRITNLLRIDYLLNELSREISDEMVLKQSGFFLLFFDLLQASAVQHNFSAVNTGLNLIGRRMMQFIDNGDSEESEKGIEHICNYMVRLGQVSASAGNDTSVLEVILNMRAIGEDSIAKKKTQSTTLVIRTLFLITKFAIDYKQYQSSQIGIYSIGLLGKLAEENDLFESTDYVIEKLREIGPFAVHSQMEWVTAQVGDELTKIGTVAIEREQEVRIANIIISLSGCLDEAIKRDVDDASEELIEFSKQLGIHSAEQKNDSCTALIVSSFAEISVELILKRRRLSLFGIILALDEIGKKSLHPILPKTLISIAEITRLLVDNTKNDSLFNVETLILPLLDSIGKSVVNVEGTEDPVPVLNAVGISLTYIAMVEIEQNPYQLAYKVVESLFEIAQLANERELSEITATYVNSLISLGLTAIREGAVSPLSMVSLSVVKSKGYLLERELELMEKDIPFFIIESIVSIGTRSGETQQKSPVYRSIIGLTGIGLTSIEKEYDSFVEKAIIGLTQIGFVAADQNIEDAAAWVIISLNRLGDSARKHNQDIFIQRAASAILLVGVYTKMAGMDKPMDYATTFFAEIAQTDEALASGLIQNLREKDRTDDFNRLEEFFLEYEMKLVKLKEENSEKKV